MREWLVFWIGSTLIVLLAVTLVWVSNELWPLP